MSEVQKPLILISNDDGIAAKGIAALVNAAKKYGKVMVVAPETAQSGMSHAITARSPLRLRKVKEEENVAWYAVNGTPVDCIKMANNQLLTRKPDLVLSGVNHGSNASVAVIYSGTVGAAVEGTLLGIPSVAISLLDHAANADFSAVDQWVSPIIEKVLADKLPHYTTLNVNIPLLPADKIKGYRFSRVTHGFWKEEMDKRTDPEGKDYFWLTGYFHNNEPSATDTDEWALANGYISVVPVYIDWTNHTLLKEMQESWNLCATAAK